MGALDLRGEFELPLPLKEGATTDDHIHTEEKYIQTQEPPLC